MKALKMTRRTKREQCKSSFACNEHRKGRQRTNKVEKDEKRRSMSDMNRPHTQEEASLVLAVFRHQKTTSRTERS